MAFNYNATVRGLTTTTVGVPFAGIYSVSGKLELNTLTEGASFESQVVVTVVQNPSGSNTTIYTGTAGSRGFSVNANCAANDVIAITLGSVNASDSNAKNVKCTISIG